jgi:hypothetical protein
MMAAYILLHKQWLPMLLSTNKHTTMATYVAQHRQTNYNGYLRCAAQKMATYIMQHKQTHDGCLRYAPRI